MIFGIYSLILILFTVFTWSLVELSLPFKTWFSPYNFIYSQRGFVSGIYVFFVILLFIFYFYLLSRWKNFSKKTILIFILLTAVILIFSYPGSFSYDIFNYIATAKVSFLYKENPYIVMPIEVINEPMLQFMHASNKIALYGPIWITMTSIPYFFGFNNLLITTMVFKIFVASFYFGLSFLIWKISEKNLQSVVFFALNPLVILETFVSGHNDVVMMFFALFAFYLLRKRRFIFSFLAIAVSILIKYATVLLIPVYLYVAFLIIRKKKPMWNSIWFWSVVVMYIAFLLSPLREEIYSWYLIWPLTFVALLPKDSIIAFISIGFSFGLVFRVLPFLYTREWGGITPTIKKITTFLPPALFGLIYEIQKRF